MIKPYVGKLIFVDEEFVSELKECSETEFSSFMNPVIDTKIINISSQNEVFFEGLVNYVDSSEVRPGNIVMKPAYSGRFVSVDCFAEDIVFRKYSLFVQLCVALGAKRVSVNGIQGVSIESSSSEDHDVNGGASSPLVRADASGQAKRSSLSDQAEQSIYSLNTTACGGEPDIAESESIISRYGLSHDPLFIDIFNMRRISTNSLVKHEVSLDFSNDVKRNFDSNMKARVEIMSKLYGANADVQKAQASFEKNRTATKLSVVVDF